MKRLFKYLEKYRLECVLSPLFKFLEAGFELIVPLVVSFLIDEGLLKSDSATVLKAGGLLLFLAFAGLGFSITAQFFAAKAATGFAQCLRQALFDTITGFDFPTLDSIGKDTLITRMISDVTQLQNGVNMFLRLFLRSPFIVFGALIMAFTVDTVGALYFVVLIPILFLLVFLIMKATRPVYLKCQAFLDRISGRIRENLTGVRVIRAFHSEKKETEGFLNDNGELSSLQKKAGGISALLNPVTLVMVNLFTAGLIYTGAIRTNLGTLSQGQVVALVNYMSQILIELIKLANLLVLLTRAAASGERVSGILSTETGESSGGSVFPPETEGIPFIEFDNVSLSYGESRDLALENISFSVNRGETVGIIGGTGSGKSSLVSLIPGFYSVSSGALRINGRDINDLDPVSLRDRIGMVFQKSELFRGSIRDNLKWGNGDASDEVLNKALSAAQALDFVNDKPGRLSFLLEQGGRNLSGGQKQRLTIARAFVKDPEILILDDAASALDLETDAKLRKAIRDLSASLTLFIVSQRAASVMLADKIIVLDDGKAVGIGTHEELLTDNSVYREIYYSQFPGGAGSPRNTQR